MDGKKFETGEGMGTSVEIVVKWWNWAKAANINASKVCGLDRTMSGVHG